MKYRIFLITVVLILSYYFFAEFLFGTPLPKPSGPYAVGSRYFYLIDKDRPDLISPDPHDHRAISMQVWYPAEPGPDDQPIPLNDKRLIEGYVQEGALSPDILTEWALEPTHSFLKAKPAKTKTPFPVILYSSSGVMNANTFLSEELASHGYVVFSVGHPYWCEFYVDAEGKTTPLDKKNEYYKQLWKEEGSWQVLKAKKEITLAETLEKRPELYEKLNQAMPTEVGDLILWAEDIAFVVDQLKEMNSNNGFFKGIMDVNRIGVMGYSKGGAAAGQYCLKEDDRCKAGINLGGFMFGDIVKKNLKKPFLIMTHIEPWAPNGLPIGQLFFEKAEKSAYMVAIRDALHGNFTDLTVAKKYIKPKGVLGPIDGENFLKIMQYYVRAFFDKYVKELPGKDIEDLSTTYPEVIFKSRNEKSAARDRLILTELMGSGYQGKAPLDNHYFMPLGKWEPARHQLEGTLAVPEFVMHTPYETSDSAKPWDYFPGFTLDFFTHGKYLVPVLRETVHNFSNRSYWCIIISPGTVWFELGDNGMSRASFPFTLVNEHFNVAHNGLATFTFDETRVSSIFFQITQETSPPSKGDFWGFTAMKYKPHQLKNKSELASRFAEEKRNQIPILPFSIIGKNVDAGLLEAFNKGIKKEEISASGLIWNDKLYLQPCHTRHGVYPYHRYMRHGAYSLTKAMGALITLLRIAEKYGEDVFNLEVSDYLEIKADHDGWNSVTFADALNMATGVGDHMPERVDPNVMQGDEDQPKFLRFLRAKSRTEKMNIAFSYGDYPWGPGEVARYNSINIFILSAAMDRFLKSKEGPDADIWDMVLNEVFQPIGIFYAPIMRTIEPDGSQGLPIFGYGLYPNVDDVAKLSILLQNNGRHQGRQLLHSGRLAEALCRTGVIGLPTGERDKYGEVTYYLAFNGLPYRCKDGRVRRIPVSTGFGGNHWVLLPNGVTAFRFCDANQYGVGSMIDVAMALCPFK
jgi:hypothetical protein